MKRYNYRYQFAKQTATIQEDFKENFDLIISASRIKAV